MKAVQIKKYSKKLDIKINNINIPDINSNQVLIKVKAAALNPLDILNINGTTKLIHNYKMPLTLGNELSGVIEMVGDKVKDFKKGDKVYTLLPIDNIGAFAEYVAVDYKYISLIPDGFDFETSAAIPLASLTIYQALFEELKVEKNKTLLITGASGSFGLIAVPIAKHFGLNVIVTGNKSQKDLLLNLGASKFIDYKQENFSQLISNVDYIIDTVGGSVFNDCLKVLKPSGTLLSLKNVPNKEFAIKNNLPKISKLIFSLVGKKYDKLAKQQNKTYKFMFVKANGEQLKKLTPIVQQNKIKPIIDKRIFYIDDIKDAFNYMVNKNHQGKIIIRF